MRDDPVPAGGYGGRGESVLGSDERLEAEGVRGRGGDGVEEVDGFGDLAVVPAVAVLIGQQNDLAVRIQPGVSA